jgi:hypothetical protein
MMNREHCEKEEQVFAALRSGAPEPAILDHARVCGVCSEVLLVVTSLQEETRLADHELATLPDPGLIWQAAQARTKQKALAKATLPIRIMRTCAGILVIFAAPWLVLEFLHPSATILNSAIARLPEISGTWLTTVTGITLVGITVTLACIAAGSWYMVREK